MIIVVDSISEIKLCLESIGKRILEIYKYMSKSDCIYPEKVRLELSFLKVSLPNICSCSIVDVSINNKSDNPLYKLRIVGYGYTYEFVFEFEYSDNKLKMKLYDKYMIITDDYWNKRKYFLEDIFYNCEYWNTLMKNKYISIEYYHRTINSSKECFVKKDDIFRRYENGNES